MMPCAIAAVLPPHQLNMVGMCFVQNRVVKHDTATRRNHDIALGMLPDLIRGQLVHLKIALDRIMAGALNMIGEIRHREIRLAGQEKLAVVEPLNGHAII